jgi:hypothetical protein
MAGVSDRRLSVCAVLIGGCDLVALESVTANAALSDLVGSGATACFRCQGFKKGPTEAESWSSGRPE